MKAVTKGRRPTRRGLVAHKRRVHHSFAGEDSFALNHFTAEDIIEVRNIFIMNYPSDFD